GIDLLRMGKPKEATARLELAARVKPGEETPEEYLGEAQASLGRYAEASEAYRRAVVRSHDSEDALEGWAGFALERFRQIGEDMRSSQEGVATVRRLQESASKPLERLVCRQPIAALERELTAEKAMREHLDVAYALSVCYALEAGKAAEHL